MADYTVTGNPAIFNDDVIIYGKLYYDFSSSGPVKFADIEVTNSALFDDTSTATFNGQVIINTELDSLIVRSLTADQNFNIGIGGTILTNNYSSNIGIGRTNPQQKLDVAGSVKIDKFIYDSINNSGQIGYYLTEDAGGIRWTELSPAFTEGIFVYNEGILIGLGQSFRGVNFKTGRSLGVGTDPVQASVNPSNQYISDVYVYDYWDFNSSGDIYRNSKVGINNSSPLYTLDVGGTVNISSNLDVGGPTLLKSTLEVSSATTLDSTLEVKGSTTLDTTLETKGAATFDSTIKLNSSLYDINNSAAIGKTDYRLASIGTGVSWRPPGVQTPHTIWVTLNGNDSNSGLLEGDAKSTVGAAASIAQPGDTIMIRSGVYYENNPIGLRTDVCVSGQDLRLVTIVPNNLQQDVFHVRRGCLIENLSFSCSEISIANTGGGAVAFATTDPTKYAVSGYISPGPVNEGPSGRWRSPYIRNCTNFMKRSIGMRINGNDATASTPGNDLKCMVCDSFTQYNEAGIGVSITNNGYAQLVSIFTINCHIGIYVDSGGSCDITNSNSSFGDYGLVANGLGNLEFSATTLNSTKNTTDIFDFQNVKDTQGRYRTPYNGQALWFQIPVATGILTAPMKNVNSIRILNGGTGFSPTAPPSITVLDANNGYSVFPLGPQGIIAQFSPTIDTKSGAIVAIDIINSGRNYLPTQNMVVAINGIPQSTDNFVVNMAPIYYTISSATEVSTTGISTATLNEFVPYLIGAGTTVNMYRISRIQTSSHSFEYIGSGTDINTSNPFQGALYNSANEVVALNGALIPYTSTNQNGNFEIGKGITIDQTTNTITGRDFNRAIQANVTPLILALR